MKTSLYKNIFLLLLFIAAATPITAQQLTINQRSYLVMNGNVSLVVNSAAFKNNGNFSAGTGTVKFTGYADTSVSYSGGTNNSTFYNLTVNKSAYGTGLKSTSTVRNILTLTGGTLFTYDKLILKSDASLTARVAAVTGTGATSGNTKVERYIPARRAWRMLTAPVTNSNTIFESWQNSGVYEAGINTFVTGPGPSPSNGLDASSLNNVSMKTWNSSTQQFSNVVNTLTSISTGTNGSADNTGYFIFVRGDRDPNNLTTAYYNTTTLSSLGKLQTGNQTFNTSGNSGIYTMVGNPYASPVDFSTITRFNVLNRFYIWDPTLNQVGGYVMLDDLSNSGTYTKSVAASNQTKEIQSGQAILVQTNATGAASVTFKETDKSTYNNRYVFRPAITSTSEMVRVTLSLVNDDNSVTLADGAFAEFNKDFSNDVDLDDAAKFTNINESLAFLRNNRGLAAERRSLISQADTLFLKLTKTTKRNYQFEITPSNLTATELVLEDKYLNSFTPLSPTEVTAYSFIVNDDAASADAARFRILLRKNNTLPVNISSIKAFIKNGNASIEWNAENEINIAKYDIEKSADGIGFSVAGYMNASGKNIYNWMDYHTSAGANFYRIKVYENSGAVKYSNIVKLAINENEKSIINIYPNPVKDNTINMQLGNQAKGTFKLKLTNMAGQVMYSGSVSTDFRNGTISVKVNNALIKGLYQLEVLTPDNKTAILKLIAE